MPGLCLLMPSSGSEGQGGEGRRTRAWTSQLLTRSFLCRSSSSLGLILSSPPTQRAATTQGRIFPSDSGSWPDGPQAWNKQSDGGGGGGGIWGQHPQNKRLPLCTSIAALPSSQQPPATLRPTAPGCLRGISLFSQVLWKKEETAICDPRLNPYMNLTARELLDHFIDKETEAQGE